MLKVIQNLTVNPVVECKAVVFDLDGTLVDSMEAFAVVAAKIMSSYYGIAPSEAKRLYRETSGLPFIQQLQVIFGDHPLNSKASDDFEIQKLEGYGDKPIFSDVIRVLPLLKAAGIAVCVSSNNSEENVRKRLEDIANEFDLIIGFREGDYPKGFCKGEPHFAFIEKELGLDRSEILFVGDSLHDAKLADECQVKFTARLGTFSAKDFDQLGISCLKVNNFFELFSAIRPSQTIKDGYTSLEQKRSHLA